MNGDIPMTNLLVPVSDPDEELFETLLQRPGVRVERIVSNGQATPPGEWYDQSWDEWVLLLAGSAELQFEAEPEWHQLKPGDTLMIPAHCRHRVEATSPYEPTIWLALHFDC
jgi:cupin 2 domain-containing protein